MCCPAVEMSTANRKRRAPGTTSYPSHIRGMMHCRWIDRPDPDPTMASCSSRHTTPSRWPPAAGPVARSCCPHQAKNLFDARGRTRTDRACVTASRGSPSSYRHRAWRAECPGGRSQAANMAAGAAGRLPCKRRHSLPVPAARACARACDGPAACCLQLSRHTDTVPVPALALL